MTGDPRDVQTVTLTAEGWRSSMELLSDAALLVSPDGVVLAHNGTARRHIGPDAIGRHLASVVNLDPAQVDSLLVAATLAPDPVHRHLTLHRPSDRHGFIPGHGAAVWSARVELVDEHWAVALRFEAPEGEVNELAAMPGIVDHLLEHLHDRDRADVALREQEERFRLAFDVSLLGMAIESLEEDTLGQILRVNDELCRMLGRHRVEIIGRTAVDFAAQEEHVLAADVFSALARGAVDRWEGERHFLRPDGRQVWAHVRKGRAVASTGPGYLITHFEDVTARRLVERQLVHQTLHDQLTGLPNRILLQDHLMGALARSRRADRSTALLFVDLDDFKLVNDTLGHQAGDEVLVAVARRMTESARDTDTIARLGGDEFVLLSESVADIEEAQDIAGRVLRAIAEPLVIQGLEIRPHASIGVAIAGPGGVGTPEELMSDADAALYAAERAGKRRQYTYSSSLRHAAVRRLDLEAGMRSALTGGQFRLMYQPVVDLRTRAVHGAEALIRWDHPTRGMLAPVEFLDIAEATDFIVDVGGWVLRQATRQAADWEDVRQQRPPYPASRRLTMAVNVSVRHVTSGRLRADVERALDAAAMRAEDLQIEITESQYMTADPAQQKEIAALADLGVTLSLDDFGTGYSSLSYLKRFPFGIVKLDRSYVSGIGTDKGDEAIVKAVLAIADALGLSSIAEGVEAEEQAVFLEEHGCAHAQGFLFSRPVPAGDFTS
jgi:diguanylate cyclase (GGDEF)-like protein/PAS domain S-box-containing protein